MSFYRTIERGVWGDEVIRECSRLAKLLFVFLCCNEHDDLAGIYRLSPAVVEDELGFSREQFFAALGELSERVSYDVEARVVWVHNMLRKQGGTKAGGVGAKHIEHARRQLAVLPRTSLKAAMVDYYQRRFGIEIGYLGEPGRGIHARAGASVSVSVSDSVQCGENGTLPEEQLTLTSPPARPPPKERKRRKKLTCSDENWTKVRGWLLEALHELKPTFKGPTDNEVNRAHIMRPLQPCGATIDDWQRVIRDQLESVRNDPAAWKYLSLGCLGKPKNFSDHMEGRHIDGKGRTNRVGGDITRGSMGVDEGHDWQDGEVEL